MAIEDLSATQRLPGDSPPRYVEVWGDTVDPRHLAWSILIGIGVSFSAFLVANAILARFVHDLAMARAYAMLVGLGGCLIGGAICARLFKPKRIAAALEADEGRRAQLIARLVAGQGTGRSRKAQGRADASASAPYGGVASLPAHVIAEMREVGLYDLFAEQERLAALGQNQSRGDAALAGETVDRAERGTTAQNPQGGVTQQVIREEAYR
ncbi:hypothetical protein [Robbsia sp. KACC 23696]|uniref:hypothetical protein n=1 Tax=Robbsia sp. KACC 23696 TaxID=3149231 RepID=UPI00325A4C54